MAAAAAKGPAAVGAGAIEGAAGTEGSAAALARAIGRVAAAVGPTTADALGVEVPAGGGEVRCTRGRKK